MNNFNEGKKNETTAVVQQMYALTTEKVSSPMP